jgi:hypothetical protein
MTAQLGVPVDAGGLKLSKRMCASNPMGNMMNLAKLVQSLGDPVTYVTGNTTANETMYFKSLTILNCPLSIQGRPSSFCTKDIAGTTSKCPKNKYNMPILEVNVPKKKLNPISKRGSVIKASVTNV